ncbi:hypothetical protein [Salinicoccus sp. HZC-1]|uniref:hypothetical protein n=1 Tax=Salinicoccus sp. HZC-1 TaxID=3385497 RepID=UPI00398B980A
MELKIINGSVQSIVEYLPKLKLKGSENRARQKLLKKASEKFQEFYSDIQEVKSEHPDDTEKQNEELETLLKEDVVIDMTEYAHMMHPLYAVLLDYPHEINTEREPGKPSDAAIHDYLIDVLEDGFDEEGNNDLKDTDAANNVEEAHYQEVE